MQIYFIRHAETEFNKQGILNGIGDSKLTELGLRQCLDLREYFKNMRISKVYSSPLSRCVESAKIVANTDQINISKELIERNFGELEGTKIEAVSIEDLEEKSESKRRVLLRICRFLNKITEEIDENGITLVFTHNSIIRHIDMIINNRTTTDLNVKNLGFIICEYNLGWKNVNYKNI